MSTLLLLLILIVGGGLYGARVWTNRLAAQAEAAIPQKGLVRAVPGGRLHYVESGPQDAPAVVLIHGLGGQLQHFDYGVAEGLASEFRVIAVDRPGCGWSDRDGAGQAPIGEQGRMIGALLDELGVEKPTLVGHSLGGAIALAMALDRPEKTGALALLCPLTHEVAATIPVFKPLEVRSSFMRGLIGATLAAPLSKRNGPAALTAVFAPEPWPEDFPLRGGGALGLRPKAFVTASEDLAAVAPAIKTQIPRYGDLKAPGGILYGASDEILAPAVHGEPMQAHGLAYEALEGRGHMIPITRPEACVDFIRRMAGLRAA
ncbi:MAG: alpha/beta fold hydrolase [Pseudomonadota bacterium]